MPKACFCGDTICGGFQLVGLGNVGVLCVGISGKCGNKVSARLRYGAEGRRIGGASVTLQKRYLESTIG